MADVRSTRRSVEGLVLQEREEEKASLDRMSRISTAAKEVWGRVKGLLHGKKVVRTENGGKLEVKAGNAKLEEGEAVVDMDELGGELEDGTVMLLEEEEGEGEEGGDGMSVRSVRSGGSGRGGGVCKAEGFDLSLIHI